MPPKQRTWNYGTAPLSGRKRTTPYKKPSESYATDRSLTVRTPQHAFGDMEYAMEVMKDPYAQDNPFIRMGLDTGNQPLRVFYTPHGEMEGKVPPDKDTMGGYHRRTSPFGVKGAITMYKSALNTLTPTEDRHVLIHELMHSGFATWHDIIKNNPKAKKAFDKIGVDTIFKDPPDKLSEKGEYIFNTLDSSGGHPYIYPKGRKSGVFPDRFRGMQDREALRTERTIPQHRGIETQSGKIVNEDWDGWKRSWYTRPVPQSYLDAVDKYVIPFIIERYPSLASHPAFRNIGKKDRVSKIKKTKLTKPESWNY